MEESKNLNFFGGALLHICQKTKSAALKKNAFQLLAIDRLISSSSKWARCKNAIQTIKKIPYAQLASFLDTSSLSVWLEITISIVTNRHTWFTNQYILWRAISHDQLINEQIEYIENIAALMNGNTSLQNKQHILRFHAIVSINKNIYIDVWSKPLLADFLGMERMERITDSSKIDSFAAVLRKAITYIETFNLKINEEINTLVREVVPCNPEIPNVYPSGTCVHTPSAVYLAYTEDVDIAAELLIHETGHLKLRILDADSPILLVNDPKEQWDSCKWYSPWRDDPRSLMGVIHAIFVFIEVANYHLYRVKLNIDNRTSLRRFTTLVYQLIEARKNNPIDTYLSGRGRLLFEEIDHYLTIFCRAVKEIPQSELSKPLYAERHRLWVPTTFSSKQAALQHSEWYRAIYMDILL